MPDRLPTIAEMAVAGERGDWAGWDAVAERIPGHHARFTAEALRTAYEAGRARMTLAEAEEEVRRG